jgi:hypothetical protein
MSKDIVLEGDTPFLATCDAPLDLINNGSIDHLNTEMMNVRWRMFPLHRHIPRDEQRNIATFARCFAELILYVEQLSIMMCFNLTYIKVLTNMYSGHH